MDGKLPISPCSVIYSSISPCVENVSIFNLGRELDALLLGASFIAYSRLPAAAVLLPSPRWRLRTDAVVAFRRLPSFVWAQRRAVTSRAHWIRIAIAGAGRCG